MADTAGALAETIHLSASRATVRPDGPTLVTLPTERRPVPAPDAPTLGPGAAANASGDDGDDLVVHATLGEGGMGRVLLAWQASLARDVAVKTLKRPSADDAELLLCEGRVTGSLEHPGIVPVHALGRAADGLPLLVMKRVDGVSLGTLLRSPHHPLRELLPGGADDPLRGSLWVLAQVCNAVHFAHSRGIVHRDIKPDNIMVGSFGEVYLLDWGIAAAAEPDDAPPPETRDLAGTPAYMAPEQVSLDAGPIGPRTDVYLLGATLHEVLTGTARHEGASVTESLESARLSVRPVYDPGVPAELASLCERATARDPRDRPESALRFRQALEDFLQHRSSAALSAQAEARLESLAALIAAPGGDRAALVRAGIECRFAFEQALRAWPDNAAARAGRERCLTLLCEDAVAQRRALEAASLLAEIHAPPPALVARLRALEDALRAEREAAEAARRAAADNDPRTGARARVAMGIVALSLGLAVSWFTQGLRLPTHAEMVRLMAVVLALVLAGGAAQRRRLMANAYSRRMTGLVVFQTTLFLAHRALGMARGTAPEEVLLGELVLAGALPGAAAILGFRELLPGALLAFAGAAACASLPGQIALIHPVALLGAQVSYLGVGLQHGQRDVRA